MPQMCQFSRSGTLQARAPMTCLGPSWHCTLEEHLTLTLQEPCGGHQSPGENVLDWGILLPQFAHLDILDQFSLPAVTYSQVLRILIFIHNIV